MLLCSVAEVCKRAWEPGSRERDSSILSTMMMKSISYGSIPMYLRKSAFYISLVDDGDEDKIDVPADCLWSGGEIGDASDFKQYLLSMQFWGIDHLTMEGLKYCFKLSGGCYSAEHLIQCMEIIADVCDVKSGLYAGLCALLDNINSFNEDDHWISEPLSSFDASVLAVVLPRLLNYDIGKIFCGYAAGAGWTDDLREFHTQYGPLWDERTCAKAAYYGHMESLLYLLENGCPCDFWVAAAAADGGHIHVLQYMHNNATGFDVQTKLWPPYVIAAAAHSGGKQFECLKYLHLMGHPWDERACEAAARGGQLNSLVYLRANGCPWSATTFSAAVYFDRLQVLQYLFENGCPRDEKACSRAAMAGHIEILKYLRYQGCPWGTGWSPCDFAAHKGKLETLQFAMSTGCQYSEKLVMKAAESGTLDCLQYLVEDQLLELDERLLHVAFQTGNVECLRYLIDVGCPFQDLMFYPEGQPDADKLLQCLVYAMDHGWIPNRSFVLFVENNAAFINCSEYLHKAAIICVDDPHSLDEDEELL